MLGPFIFMKDIIVESLYEFLKETTKKYLQRQYGHKVDICLLDIDKDNCVYTTSKTFGAVPATLESMNKIRNLCGQNILSVYGLPLDNENPYVLKLFIKPSIIKKIGILKSIELCKNWVGDSKVGDIVVVKYV
jgi:hypothetical protein